MSTFYTSLLQTPALKKGLPYNDVLRLFNSIQALYEGRWSQVDITTTGTVNNHAPAVGAVVRCNNASALSITGIVPTQDNEIRIYRNVGSSTIRFSSEDGGSTAANRISMPMTYQWLGAGGSIGFHYDPTSDRWRVLFIEPGSWISPTFSAGDFTASGSMTWTLAGEDVETYAFRQQGRTVDVKFRLNTTTVGGTPDTALYILIPGGLSVTVSGNGTYAFNDNAAGWDVGIWQAATGVPTKIGLYHRDFTGSNWAAATNATAVYGTASGIEVG